MAQKSNEIEVLDENNDVLSYAWAGGLNAPQFSEIDLNGDNIMDLFVFDREGNRVLTFLNGGSPGKIDYSYAPEYEASFPPMSSWATLVDYNMDGKNDLFTYNNGGIAVYKNTSTSGNLAFSLVVYPYLTSYFSSGQPPSNIYVSPGDIPAIVDVDFDGDIDVLCFGLSNPEAVSFYENFAKDSNSIETFKFHDNTYCWGNFKEEALTNKVVLNKSCPKLRKVSKGNKHSGASISAFDPDGDKDMDLLLGDPTFSNLVFLENGGSQSYANIVAQDTTFPSYNDDIDLRIFPAAFHIDVNNDGLKDLIVAPNATNGIENQKGILYYKNIGSASMAIYSYITNDFLQSSMIDLGSYAYPILFDYNFDGLMDLLVGNGGYFNGPLLSVHSLTLFENIGTANLPKFKLIDDDYAGITQLALNTSVNKPTFNLVPCAGDFNRDGAVDFMIGDFQGRLHYFVNQPVAGKSNLVLNEVNYMSIDVSSYASPFFIDLDEDGLVDIVSGRQNGKLNFYKNKGTDFDPLFDSLPDKTKLGLVDTKPWNDYDGFSQARFYRAEGDLYLLSGSKTGTIYHYGNISNNINGQFTLLDSMFLNIDVGSRSFVEIGDLNNDGKFELIVGNASGGLNYFSTEVLVGAEELKVNKKKTGEIEIRNIGNAHYQVTCASNFEASVSLYNITGQELQSEQFRYNSIIDLTNYHNGVYLIAVKSKSQTKTQKIILTK